VAGRSTLIAEIITVHAAGSTDEEMASGSTGALVAHACRG
jgi:hypothetical protein